MVHASGPNPIGPLLWVPVPMPVPLIRTDSVFEGGDDQTIPAADTQHGMILTQARSLLCYLLIRREAMTIDLVPHVHSSPHTSFNGLYYEDQCIT